MSKMDPQLWLSSGGLLFSSESDMMICDDVQLIGIKIRTCEYQQPSDPITYEPSLTIQLYRFP